MNNRKIRDVPRGNSTLRLSSVFSVTLPIVHREETWHST